VIRVIGYEGEIEWTDAPHPPKGSVKRVMRVIRAIRRVTRIDKGD
jgi:hypothetical protein